MNRLIFKFLPFIAIVIVWFLFSSPFFLRGRVPFPSSYQLYSFSPWEDYAPAKGAVKNGAMPDLITQIYPWKHFTIESLKQGIIPFWNPYSLSGTPHLANYQSAVLSPFNLLFFIFPFVTAWSFLILLQPLLAGTFMYLFVRSVKVSKAGSVLSAIGFMFCGFMTVWMEYGTLGYALLFLPLALWSIEKFYEKNQFRYLITLSLSITSSFLSGHFQISLYIFIFIFAFALYKAITIKRKLNTIYLILYTVFGLLLAMPQILPSLQVYTQSLRSSIFQKGETIPWSYLPSLLAPDFFGNPVTRNDWFGHYAEWNMYIGLVPLSMAVYAVMRRIKHQALFFLITGLFSLLLAFSTPLLDLIIALHIPVLSTSAASRIIALFSFSFLVLAGFGFDRLLEDIKNKKYKYVWTLLSLFFVIFGLLWSVVILKLSLPIDKIAIAKQNLVFPTILLLSVSAIIGLISILEFGGMRFLSPLSSIIRRQISLWLKRSRVAPIARVDKIRRLLVFLLLLITMLDLLRFATKWQAFDPKDFVFSDTPLFTQFHPAQPYERVLDNFGAEGNVYYHLSSVEGYDAVYLKRYGEFMAYVGNTALGESERSVVRFPKNSANSERALDLLNVTYLIHRHDDGRAVWVYPYWLYPGSQFTRIYNDPVYEVLKNTKAYSHAFLVNKYAVKTDPSSILNTLFSNKFDPRQQVVLEKVPRISISQNNAAGSSKIISYTPNEIRIAVNTKSNSLLFLSDAYYPEWQANIDGKPGEILRADYAFRAIPVPAGNHIVTFSYYPRIFILGIGMAIIGILGIMLMMVINVKGNSHLSRNKREL